MFAAFSLFGIELPIEVLVLGLITGLTYALLAVGLVLAYKSSRVINFAHGEMGALAASLIPLMVVKDHYSYWVALPVALLVAAGTGVFMEYVVIRKFARAPRLIVLVATIGAAQLFFAMGAFIPKGNKLASAVFPVPFKMTFTVGNLRLGTPQLLIVFVVPVITAALACFFRYTKLGIASRASAENSDAAELAGVHVPRVSLVIWIVTGLIAGVSGILIGGTRPVVSQVALGPSLLLRALAAAMLGGLVSMPRAFAGGIAIGVIEAIVAWNYPTGGTLEVVLFVLILASLLLGKGLTSQVRGTAASSWSLSGAVRKLNPSIASLPVVVALRRGFLLALVGIAAVLPIAASNSQRVLMSSMVLFAAMGLSLVVLTGYAGQVSLGQFAFVGLGALAGGRMHQLGYSPWMALLFATAAGGAVALIVGLPALRIRGLFLAVITLAFAVAAAVWLYSQHWLVHNEGGQTSLVIPRPRLLGVSFQSELRYYWLSLGAFCMLAVVVGRLASSGIGRSMMAVRDNEASAASMGISPARVKLTAFVLAGMMAAFAGYFYGGLLVNFGDTKNFSPELSLALVGLVILGGVTTITGAVLGALWLQGLGYVLAPLLPGLLGANIAVLLGGLGLLGALLTFPGGIAEPAFALRDRILQTILHRPLEQLGGGDEAARSRPKLEPKAPVAAAAVAAAGDPPLAILAAENIVVRFGGNVAVDHVSMHVNDGEIVGLVGPNGAGKTTLFDVLTGQIRPAAGRVVLAGEDITRMRPEQRAWLGLGRTFQQARLYDGLALIDAFKVALEREDPSEIMPSVLGLLPARRSERNKSLRASELIDLLGLGAVAHRPIAELSTGTRRMVELGCLIALGADVLLLDEPTAGIAQREVEAFRPVIRDIRDHLGATMVVVEHDIPLIMGLVDRLYVLNAGKMLAEGKPGILRDDPAVVAAYLGTDERAIRRSGEAASLAAAVGVTGQ